MSNHDQHTAEIIGHKSALDGMRKFVDDEKAETCKRMGDWLCDGELKDLGLFSILTGQLIQLQAMENWITLNYDKGETL